LGIKKPPRGEGFFRGGGSLFPHFTQVSAENKERLYT